MDVAPWHLLIIWCALLSTGLPRPLELRFTRTFYNVTIPENSVSRTLVTSTHRMGVFRHSGDEDVTFRILSGDPDRIFKAEDKEVGDFIFLILRTRGGNSVVLNRERKDKFVLTVKAFSTRSTIEATTIIYVRVLDQNDLSPIFVPSEYNKTIPEDLALYKPIVKVSAEDADLSVSGEIFYSIRESSGYFSVHPFTGEVTLTKRLKYSERSVHDLMIVAQDRATIFRGGGHVTLAKATVRVKQVNLYGPEIYVYVLQDPSAHKLGLVYAVVRVVDRDEGVHGKIGDISIVNGDNEDIFIINPVDENKNNSRTEYNIILAEGVTINQSFLIYNLSLRVTDDGFPQRKSYKTVSILVQSDSDKEPYFENESYEINVPEYLPQGSPIVKFNVHNSDVVLPNDIELRIVEGNAKNKFSISSKNFILYTSSKLDAESQLSYTLTVKLLFKDREISRHPYFTKVKINVLDYNDNDPVLNEFPDEIWVNENQPAGTHVAKIAASDSDSGKNGFLTFSIVNSQFVPFEIDPLSGIIRSTQPLDFESMKRDYLLTIRVSDSGQPFRRQTQSQLNVQIRNLNDNSPLFLKGDCSISIPTTLPIDSHLITVTALDLDEMDIMTYSITSSFRNDCIKVNPANGKLTLGCDLKDIYQKEWEANVTASDGLYKTKTSIKVFISSSEGNENKLQRVQYSCRDLDFNKRQLDSEIVTDESDKGSIFELPRLEESENLHEPEIILSPQFLEILETQQMNTGVYVVKALDMDTGYNGKLVFDLASDRNENLFKMDPDNGTIVLLSSLTISELETFNLNITVCDQGNKPLCTSALLFVKVVEDADKTFKFKQNKFIVHVRESMRVGQEIITTQVVNSKLVTYSLISGGKYFSIDSKNGTLLLKEPLDRESIDHVVANIRARLTNNSDVFADTTVTVVIEDENDNAPSFVNTHYTINVREDVPTGSIIYIVNAVDYDLGRHGSVAFSLLDTEVFTIDGTTGVIRLNRRLDYETKREHQVVVQASDQGTPSLSSQVTLTVLVTDVNENMHPPVFEEVVVLASVKENMPLGSAVVTVTASDADLPGDDSRIIYNLREGDGLGFFNITEQGTILTSVVLDAELKSSYWLTVFAEDCGSIPLSGFVQVYVQVLDENDHLPLTLLPSYHFLVEENLPSHSPVGQITASDADLETQQLKFTLAPSADGLPLPFSIESKTGFISTTSLLDRDEVDDYVINVIVSDGGSPELSSTSEVMVNVLDVNDNTPQFLQEHYSVRLSQLPVPLHQRFVDNEVEQEFPDGDKWLTSSLLVPDDVLPLAQVLAVDMDAGLNGSVSYSVQSGSPFLVHPETGQMYAHTRLMPGREYDVMVKASDNGIPSRSSTTRVTFHTLHKQHTLKQGSSLRRISVEIQENIKPGTSVIKLNASVHDKSQLFYVISGGNGTSHFVMQGDTLLVARRWDSESGNMFHLRVSASNHSFTWLTEIWIKLVYVNKFHPKFDQELYTVNISEDSLVGTVLLTLQAIDEDVNASLTYHIHNAQPGSGMFSLDSIPGDLVLSASLDRETLSSHLLTVKVSDGSNGQRHGFARVIIHVKDANDNKPVWPTATSYFKVSEDTPVSSLIGRLVATDIDKGRNGTVKYRIVSGNSILKTTFSVEEDTGTIQLVAPLDAWFNPKFLLVVQAQDLCENQPLDSSVQVDIAVVPSERKSPRCLADTISLDVSEVVHVGEVVGHVTSYFIPSLYYQLADTYSRQDFLVNPSSGDIIVQRSLDFEATPSYNLTVIITSMAGKSTYCKVELHVVDFNDNKPTFTEELYSGFVQESAPPGTIVMTEQGPLRVLAEDLDSGVNGVLQFTVQDGPGHDLLTIDPITGTVRTTQALDYEQLKYIRVKVSVSDWGVPRLYSDYLATLQVQILNVNDCPPLFDQPMYNVTLTLPVDKDILLVQVNAEDPDSTEVSSLTYSIVLGNEDLALSIDENTGEIYLQEPLKLNPRQIKVRVHDGLFEDVTFVNIHTRLREPSPIRFQKPLYLGAVLENSTKVSIVAVVDVLGARLNEVINFSILNRSPQFTIGNTSGVITTNGYVFDREKRYFYQLNVKAFSIDRNVEALTTVNITVLDTNDHCPRFTNLPYRATITSNATKGDFIFKVHAKDMDTGENGEVRYELDQSSLETFRIGRKSGEIRLKTLSIYYKHEFNVVITANDGGIVPCSTTTHLVVSVIDSRAPLWERTVYKGQLSESAVLLSAVPVSLKAAAANKVLYQLISSETFLLRHDSGVLQVYDTLDRETVSSYTLTLRATDVVSRLHADTILLLDILDVNDCYPEFLQDSYTAKVAESTAVGTKILQVSAADRDSGMNAVIRYALSHPLFRVDPEDGWVVLARRVDYEQSKVHHVTVTATDSGVPPLSSFVTVTLEVMNVNDNNPKIINDNSTFRISQNAERNSLVGKVIAQDNDGDELRFILISREWVTQKTFLVDKYTGLITISNPSLLLSRMAFNLNVSVDDGVHYTTGLLTIKVLPSNRHSPVFDLKQYGALIKENLPAGHTVIKVTASDKDADMLGNVAYTLPLQSASTYFAIDKFTGVITTLKPLDRENVSVHQLDVTAMDGGGLQDWTSVRVTVLDNNDNPPKFILPKYVGCVPKNLTRDHEILRVKAEDPDEAAAGRVKYSITRVEPQQAREWFHIEPREGAVYAYPALVNQQGSQEVNIIVKAMDEGTPPLSSEVSVKIIIMSANHNSEFLRQFPSTLLIPFYAKPGYVIQKFEFVSSVKAEIHIIGGDDDSVVVNSSGHLFLKRLPKFRKKSIGVFISSSKNPYFICYFKQLELVYQQSKLVFPEFIESKIKLSIPEIVPLGYLVHKVTIHNEVSVHFTILEETEHFSIDPLTGWITVTSVLDRDTIPRHEFSVLAAGKGLDQSKCSVTITLTDVNDNPHIFNQEVYNVAVKESAPVGTLLTRLSLVDPDELRGELSFFITQGDDFASFTVTHGMELTLTRALDRESISNYVLSVLASDGVFTATTIVNVVVIDVNDERHSCVYSSYLASVSESHPPGHLVTSILTSDLDLESPLEYQLSGVGAERFSIDNHGEIRLKQFLDREAFPSFVLEAKVVDTTHHKWFCTSRVRVTVEDINDNSPYFAVINETVTLTEDATVGMLVTKVQVLDFDQGKNRQVSFFPVGANHMFNLSSSSGLLTLARPMQSTPGSVHSVTVGASDHGSPRLTSVTTVQVIVVGMNDDPPAHVLGAFHVTVSEDAPVGTALLHLRTLHNKETKKAQIIYTILEGNGQAEFEIDRNTGVLATAKPLDYEAHQGSQLLILATSVGEASMINYISVNVSIVDVNDNPPVFKVTRYSVQIREDVEVGQMVLKVDVEDVDSGKNGVVKFSLDKESARKFTVDSYTGVLMVANQLDREQCGEYTVLVIATDQGSPSLSSTVTVNIDVTDVNDNPPSFLHPNSTAVLQADRMPGWAVFHFAVTDPDQASSSSHFSFQITGGNKKGMFRIDPDGTLRTTDKLAIKLNDSFKLTVQVNDGGSPNLYSSTWIYIKVVEPSKHPPVIFPLRVWVGVYENQWQGGDIGQVTATDLDPYDKLEYSLPATPQFTVDPSLGTLKVRGSLAPGAHSVNISVTDGKFVSSSVVTVTVQSLSQDMLQTSVYIRLFLKVKQDILVRKLPLFLSTLHSAFLRDVNLISLQDIPNSTIGMLIAVAGGADLHVVQQVMSSAGLQGSTPQCDCRNGGVCQRQLQIMPDKTNVFSGAGLSFVTPGHSLSYYCICSIGYAGEHCEEIKCMCPPLQVCVPQRVGFSCMPPCSANQSCPAAMTSSVTWPEIITCVITAVVIILTIVVFVVYRRYKNSATSQAKYGSWGKHNLYIQKKTKLSNIEASQKPPIFTGSPNNGTTTRNNLDISPGAMTEGEAIPLDYLRNINPIPSKIENDILQGHSSAPDLATCHSTDSSLPDDPARELAALDEQLSQDVVQYGFPPPGSATVLPPELEIPL